MAEMTVQPKEYEITYLIDPSLAEAEIEAENMKIQGLVVERDGIISQSFAPLKKRLFYPVKKQNQAYLGTFYFSIAAEKMPELKKALQLYSSILRFLILDRTEAIKHEAKTAAAKLQEPKPETSETPEPPKAETEESFAKKLEQILKR